MSFMLKNMFLVMDYGCKINVNLKFVSNLICYCILYG